MNPTYPTPSYDNLNIWPTAINIVLVSTPTPPNWNSLGQIPDIMLFH